MDWAEKSKLQIEKWLISARWYYSAAVLLVAVLPWLLSLSSDFSKLVADGWLDNLRLTEFPILSLFIICLVFNTLFDVWLHVLERRWRLLKKISTSLIWLSVSQIVFDLTWISAAIYLGQISSAVYPLFYFIPIVESIVLFSLWGPVMVALLSAGLVTVLTLFSHYGGESMSSASLFGLLISRLTEVIAPSMAVTIIYLVIGFFGAYLSGVVRERGELLARENSSFEFVKKQGQALAEQAKFQERNMTAKELELSLANQKLRELDISRNRFVSVTTHQMRTPLAGIKWTLSMLGSGQLGEINDEAKVFIQKGLESTDNLIHIINDLLTVDQVDAKESEVKLESLDLINLLDEVSHEFSSQAHSRNINFSFVRPDWGVPKIEADRQKIKIVLENLIDNAIKYTKASGRVTVKVSGDRLNTAEPQLEVTVADSGMGINQNDKAKIFHKFYRGTGAVQAEPDGTGIGLYICRDIIEKHHGTIWYESRPGDGTIFHFTLPVKQK